MIGQTHVTLWALWGQVISRQKAQDLLKVDLHEFEAVVNKLVTAPITVNMFNALVSFCYNVGPAAFKKSSPLRLTNERKYVEAANSLRMWDKPNGILARRKKEIDLYLNGNGVLSYNYTKKPASLFKDVVKLGFLALFI